MFAFLPSEIVVHILSGLPTETLIRLSRTSRLWHQTVSQTPSIWSSVRIAENCESMTDSAILSLLSYLPKERLVSINLSGCLALSASAVLPILTGCPALSRLSLIGCHNVDLVDLITLITSDKETLKDCLSTLVLSELNLSMTMVRDAFVVGGLMSPHRTQGLSLKFLKSALTGDNNRNILHFDIFPCQICQSFIAPHAPRHCSSCSKSFDYLCQFCAESTLWTCTECSHVSYCPPCNDNSKLVQVQCSLLTHFPSGTVYRHHLHSSPVRLCQRSECEGVRKWKCWVCGWYDCPLGRKVVGESREVWGNVEEREEYEMRRVSEVCSKCHRGICRTCLVGSSCPCESSSVISVN